MTRAELVAVIHNCQPVGNNMKQRLNFTLGRKDIKELFDQLNTCQSSLDSLINKNAQWLRLREKPAEDRVSRARTTQKRAAALHDMILSASPSSAGRSRRISLQLRHRPEWSKQHIGPPLQIAAEKTFRMAFDQPSGGWQEAEVYISEAGDPIPFPAKPLTLVSEIADIWQTLEAHTQRVQCVGLHLDLRVDQKLKGLYQPVGPPKVNAISGPAKNLHHFDLGQLLARPSGKSAVRRRLSRTTRADLAALVASSVLELYDTPFVSPCWTKRDLVFYSESGLDAARCDELYLLYELDAARLASASNISGSPPSAMAILMLGLLLLELWFGQGAESRPSCTTGTGNRGTVWNVLDEWLDHEGDDLPDQYLKAVQSCMGLGYQEEKLIIEGLESIVQKLEKVSQAFK